MSLLPTWPAWGAGRGDASAPYLVRSLREPGASLEQSLFLAQNTD